MKKWLRYEKKFTPKTYDFKIFDLWKEGFYAAKPFWLRFLVADLILIMVMYSIFWVPKLGQWFPFLQAFRIHPDLLYPTDFMRKFQSLSVSLFPMLFSLFFTVPVYLGVNLLALRVAYQRAAPLSLLSHYISFFWWGNLLCLLIISGGIFVPSFFLLHALAIKSTQLGNPAPFYVGALACGLAASLVLVTFSMTFNLVFGARIFVWEAMRMSARAVKQHFWRIFGMLLLVHLVQNIGERTFYLADILLYPPMMMSWALLYKKIFGEKGLVE